MERKKCRIFILFRFGRGYIEYNHIRESCFHGLIEHDYIWKAEWWKWGTKASKRIVGLRRGCSILPLSENKGVQVCFRRRRKTKSFDNPEKAKAENSGRLGDCGCSIKRY